MGDEGDERRGGRNVYYYCGMLLCFFRLRGTSGASRGDGRSGRGAR